MKILEHHNLKPLTSMYVGGNANFFVEVSSVEEVKKAISFAEQKNIRLFVLGGGSNIIVSDKGFNGLVIKINIKGVELLNEDSSGVEYEIGAGESWDDFVKFCVEHELYGVENLSHIPGTVGASAVQNIGAYGAEVSNVVTQIKVIDTVTLEEKVIKNSDLNFSYRKSILNTTEKGRYIVTSVIFNLKKKGELNMKYDDIKKYFINNPNIEPNLKSLREAIINIRNKKFPFPDSPENGTVGSFWNATPVDEATFDMIVCKLKNWGFTEKAGEMLSKKSVFMVAQGFKVVPGLFVEILNLKGKSVGGAKILETHAGVINNYSGTALARDVIELSDFVRESLKKEFNIEVSIEPELVGDF